MLRIKNSKQIWTEIAWKCVLSTTIRSSARKTKKNTRNNLIDILVSRSRRKYQRSINCLCSMNMPDSWRGVLSPWKTWDYITRKVQSRDINRQLPNNRQGHTNRWVTRSRFSATCSSLTMRHRRERSTWKKSRHKLPKTEGRLKNRKTMRRITIWIISNFRRRCSVTGNSSWMIASTPSLTEMIACISTCANQR